MFFYLLAHTSFLKFVYHLIHRRRRNPGPPWAVLSKIIGQEMLAPPQADLPTAQGGTKLRLRRWGDLTVNFFDHVVLIAI